MKSYRRFNMLLPKNELRDCSKKYEVLEYCMYNILLSSLLLSEPKTEKRNCINVSSSTGCFVRTVSVFCETSFFFSICLYWVNHHVRKIASHSHIHCQDSIVAILPLYNSALQLTPPPLSNTIETQGRGAPGAKHFGKWWETQHEMLAAD